MRQTMDLTGLWRFAPDAYNQGEAEEYFAPTRDVSRWREVEVPCAFDSAAPGMEGYEGTGWFRRPFVIPLDWRGRRIILRFEAVNYHARVWLNGQLVGTNEDGFLPFEFDVTDEVGIEQDQLAVEVNNTRRPGEVPGLERGWRPFGGILREVTLRAEPWQRIEGVQITAEPADGDGRFTILADVANGGAADRELVLAVDVHDGDAVKASAAAPTTRIAAGEAATLSVSGHVPDATPWSPQQPKLYTAHVRLLVGEKVIDSLDIRFGFRRIEARAGKLLLNGREIFLTGYNRHEDSPTHGMCTDLATVRQDLLDMKGAGCNFVRLCHCPHHPGELDLCDELGLLVMEEIPLYWWRRFDTYEESDDAKLAAARRQLTTMIRRDQHHPSVIFWSVSNETGEKKPQVSAGNAELVNLARLLDPTRLAVHVSMFWHDAPHFEADDVLCVNSYPTLAHRAGPRGRDAFDPGQWWATELKKLHQLHPDKPILVAEFGYPALEGVCDNALGQDEQARAIAAEFAGMTAPYVCGATIWCWADHPWPEEPFINRITTSPYGVVTRKRQKLPAFWKARELFMARQGQAVSTPPAAAARVRPSEGWQVTMIRPHLRDIPNVPFPEGFSIRPMRLDDAGLWTDIWRDAEQYYGIGDNLFLQQFGTDTHAIGRRCYLILGPRNLAVGTLSAWYNRDFRGADAGQVHWVAVRPAYQNKGLARAGLSYALRQLAQWHQRAFLGTQTARLAAIKLYLDFGFLPDLCDGHAIDAWREVRTALPHPALAAIDALGV